MKPITKKRTWAVLIDIAIAGAVNAGVEALLRKKVKNEAFHHLVTPSLTTWGLEYVQLRMSGQTIGYRLFGLTLESEDGSPLSSEQIVKRIVYRDFASSISYMKNRDNFSQKDGRSLAQDRYSHTIVTTKNT